MMTAFTIFVLGYTIVLNGFYMLFNILAFFHLRRYMGRVPIAEFHRVFRSRFFPSISLLVPAYNESVNICESVQSLLMLQYPEYEVVVINDGSTDDTLARLIDRFKLKGNPWALGKIVPCKTIRAVYTSENHPNLFVIDKENGGKADALNAGINVSKHQLFCAIDGDSILEKDCLLKIVRPFLTHRHTIAAGGIVRIANGCTISHGNVDHIDLPKGHLERFQVLEYLRSYLFGRVGLDFLGCTLVISGAFGLFKKEAVVAAGGYLASSIGEDMELVVRLHHLYRKRNQPYSISFVPDPVCWTEVPADWHTWFKQRNRWQRGLMDSLFRHIGMLCNPRYGRIGMIAMPFFFFLEMLSPIIESLGYIFLFSGWISGILNVKFAVLMLTVMLVLGINLSLASLCLEELSFKRYPRVKAIIILFFYAFIENFGYRQIHALCRLKGTIDYFRGKKSWGAMTRRGFTLENPALNPR